TPASPDTKGVRQSDPPTAEAVGRVRHVLPVSTSILRFEHRSHHGQTESGLSSPPACAPRSPLTVVRRGQPPSAPHRQYLEPARRRKTRSHLQSARDGAVLLRGDEGSASEAVIQSFWAPPGG